MAHSSSDYTLQKLVVDSLQEDGALINMYSKEYNEQGTLDGGTSNRAVFKKYNDKITSYHNVLKVLTGEQRANISEGIPAVDFLHPENTSMMYTYPLKEDGTVDPSTIVPIPEDSTKTALDYIEEDDPYIINRALAGSDLKNHFYNTDGNIIGDTNIQTSTWQGDFAFVYKGISNPSIVNPLDNEDIYTSLRKTSIFSTKANSTSWIEVDLADRETPEESDPQEITADNASTCLDATDNPFVIFRQNRDKRSATVYLEANEIAIAFPSSSYSTDVTKLLVFKVNGANTLTGLPDSYKQFILYINSFNMSNTPDETVVEEGIPEYLATDYFAKYLNLYGVFNKEYYAAASGLLNGAYCEPYEFTTTAENKTQVTKWKFEDDIDEARSKGVAIEVGDKYFKGHILKRGAMLDAPLKTTNEAEEDYNGKATYIFDQVNTNISGLFKNIQIDDERWQNFLLKSIDEVTNKADYSGESLTGVQAADYLGLESKNTTLSSSQMIYPDKLKTVDGNSVSYDQIREIIERCTTTEMYGPRIQGDTVILDLSNPSDGCAYSISRVENATVLNFGWATNKTNTWRSEKSLNKNYDAVWYARYNHRHKKRAGGKYPIFNTCQGLSISVTSPINIFSKKSNPSAETVLVYPEYNKFFPENLFLISRSDLGLERYEGSATANIDPSRTKKGLCSLYNPDSKCVISFKVEKVDTFFPSRIRYADIYDSVDREVGGVWSRHVPVTIGNSYNITDPETGEVELVADTSNDCYIYTLAPMEMTLENITIYDQNNNPVNMNTSEGKVSIVPMSYPSNYFPVTITEDREGNNQYIIDVSNRTTDIRKLKGSFIIPGIPVFDSPEDLRNKKHRGSGLSLSIFADLFGSGLGAITSTILKKGIYRTLYDWPVSTGDAGSNISNPIRLGDLKDTLSGLSSLGPSLRRVATGNTFTIPVDGNLREDYTYQGNPVSWDDFLAIDDAAPASSSSEATKKKVIETSENNVIYECIKEVTNSTKELEDSNYWGNYWERYSRSKINFSSFTSKTAATVGTAYQIITEPSWSGMTLNCVLICKQEYSGVTLTESNYATYWYVIPTLDTWEDLLEIDDISVTDNEDKIFQITGQDPDGYEYQVYTYKALTDLTARTYNLKDSNYYGNYWSKKNSSTWLELLNCNSAIINDVFYVRNEDPEGNVGTYYGCIQRVTHSCNNDPTSQYYWGNFWRKRSNLTTKVVTTDDLDNLYNRIDCDDPSAREYALTVALDRNSSDWDVQTSTIHGYQVLGDTLTSLIKRRLENCIKITKVEGSSTKERPSFRKLQATLENIFDGNARITREACQNLDNLLGNNTRAFLSFGDASNEFTTPEEVVNLEEDLYENILTILTESDRDIKNAQETCEKSRIDTTLIHAFDDIIAEANNRYDNEIYYEELQKSIIREQEREAWDHWSSEEVVKNYYTSTARTTFDTTKEAARGLISRIKSGVFTGGAFTSWLLGWSSLSLNDFISRYQLDQSSYVKRTETHRWWLFGWHTTTITPPIEYVYENESNAIREAFRTGANREINTLITQNPKPASYEVLSKSNYVQSQKNLYTAYTVAHNSGSQSAGAYSYAIPADPANGQKAVINENTVSLTVNGTQTSFTLSGRTINATIAAGTVVVTYYLTSPLGVVPIAPSAGDTITDPNTYPVYENLSQDQILNYLENDTLDYIEIRDKGTVELNQKLVVPEYNRDWTKITSSSTISNEKLKDIDEEDLQVPVKIIDVSRDVLEGLATYVKKALEGQGEESGFVKYVEGQEKDGVPSGRSDSLYYKRWQVLNNRLNRTNGPLYKAATYLNNRSAIQEPKNYQKNVRKSYKDFMEVMPVAEISPLVYMKREPATATTVEIPGKFYFENEMKALAAEISSKCILTCNKCPQQKSCPFYNEDELIKLYCDECQTIDIWVKDNKLDLLYYNEGEVSDAGVVTNRSPYLVYRDSSNHTEELSHELFKKIHKPYADISKKVGSNVESYTIQNLDELRAELSNKYPEFANYEKNSIGWLIGGRYGTVGVNNYARLDNEAYPDLELPQYKYLYDAMFVEDEVSYIEYGESEHAYPVSVTITDASNTEKTYSGTTKLMMPRALKLFKGVNPNSDVYLVSDDTKDANNNSIVPLIYLGSISSLQMAFDLQDDPISEERITANDTKLYAKDVAQWCVNEAKQACIYNPLDSQFDTNLNKDQYWMTKIQKRINTEGSNIWLECEGRRRISSGYQEPVMDPNNLDEAMTIAGRPLVTNYQDFLRKVSIRMNDGNGNDLIPWVKEGSGLNVETQKSTLPLMKTNLRLAVVKTL